jgi:hypothetical protein
MSYVDLGFDKNLNREIIIDTQIKELSSAEANIIIPQLSGSNIKGGVIKSADGRLEIDLNEGTIGLSDGALTRIYLDGDDGTIKVSRSGYDARNASNANLIMSSDFSYVREVWLQMIPQWDNSWTTNNTYTDVTGSINAINFDDWPDHTWYFEMIGKTDAGTGYYQLYNTTDDAAVTGSEISTTSTSVTRIRSSAITKLSGTKVIKIQHKVVGGDGATQYVNSVMARCVFRVD